MSPQYTEIQIQAKIQLTTQGSDKVVKDQLAHLIYS